MSRQAKLWLGAIVAGLAVAVLPSFLLGPSTDFSGSLALGSGGMLAALPILFAAGVLTSLTPCVYPLIPITVSIFGARQSTSRARGAMLSATYVLGIAAMYSVLGVAAAASGKAFGTFMGNPLVVAGFAVMMLVFAASMFGAFEIRLPGALQARLSGVAGVGFGSAFAMGLVAGVVAAPCTGPVLGAVLTFVASSGNLWVGFWLLFTYAIGMGLLFFVLGTFSVSLPRSGAWMDAVKAVLGVALVVVAFSFVRPLVWPKPPEVSLETLPLAAIAGVLAAIAVLAGAVHRSFHGGGREVALKSLGLVLLIGALALRFEWIVEPVRGGAGEGVAGRIEWIYDEGEALALAKAENKPVLVDFFATWCAACVELDKYTFSDARVRQVVADRFVPLKIDGTEDTDDIAALHSKYGVMGLPVVAVLSPDGKQLPEPRITGFVNADEMLRQLGKVQDEQARK